MTTLEHPIYYSGHAVPRTQRITFQVGRALPGSPFTKGTRWVPVPGRHRGVQPSRVRAQSPLRALAGRWEPLRQAAGPRRRRPGRPRAAAPSQAAGKGGQAGTVRTRKDLCVRARAPAPVREGPPRPAGKARWPRLRAGSRRRTPAPRRAHSGPRPGGARALPGSGKPAAAGAQARLAGRGRPLVPSGACCRPAAGGGPEQDGELPPHPGRRMRKGHRGSRPGAPGLGDVSRGREKSAPRVVLKERLRRGTALCVAPGADGSAPAPHHVITASVFRLGLALGSAPSR